MHGNNNIHYMSFKSKGVVATIIVCPNFMSGDVALNDLVCF